MVRTFEPPRYGFSSRLRLPLRASIFRTFTFTFHPPPYSSTTFNPSCYHKHQNGCAMFTRLGYFVIIAIISAAVLAIAFVVWSSLNSSDSPSASAPEPSATAAQRVEITPAASNQPTIPFSRVIDFARLGAVQSIASQGQDVTVTFRADFDTSGFSTTSHVFRSSLEPGQDVLQVLEAAGIPVNGAGGVTVTKR